MSTSHVDGVDSIDTTSTESRTRAYLAAIARITDRPVRGVWSGSVGHQFAELTDSERIVANLYRAYAELDGAAPGAPIDVLSALRDTIVYNGGPLRCLA